MRNVRGWLQSELGGLSIILVVMLGVAGMMITAILGVLLLRTMGMRPDSSGTVNFGALSTRELLFEGSAAALIEEMMFRLPLYLVACWSRRLLVPAAIASSALFGYLHGDITNIPVQGAGGLVLSAIFLKCGGAGDNPLAGLEASTVTHILFNAALFVAMSY